MMNMDVHATEYYLEKIAFADKKDDYVRLQKETTCPMDKVAPSDITNLKNDGLALFQDNKEKIVKFIKMVMDEKYGAWTGFHKIYLARLFILFLFNYYS